MGGISEHRCLVFDAPAIQGDSKSTGEPGPMDKAKFPIVYLPIDIKDRELNSRLLLALDLLKRGFVVLVGVGHEMILRQDYLPPGILLVKGLNAVQCAMMRDFGAMGHQIMAIDEEALGICDADLLTRLVAPSAHKLAGCVFCQGEF